MKPQNRNNTGGGPAPLTRDRREDSQNKRYSWVDTPVEMRTSAFRPEESIPPLPALPTEHANATPYLPVSSPTQYTSDNPPDRSTSPYNFAPPTGTHPAQYAPYADDMASETLQQPQQLQLPPQPPTPHTPTTPHSPGPVPIKSDLERGAPETTNGPRSPNTQQPQSFAAPPRAFSSYQPDVVPGVATGAAIGPHTPGQISHPNQKVIGGGWTHGLCDCGDVSACCVGLWCPCILYGKTQYRLSQRSAKKDPTNMLGYETCNGSCVAFSVLCGFNWLLTAIQHTRTRKQYEIPGSYGSDCIRSCCCCCCVLVQDEREIKYREGHARRNAGPAAGASVMAPYAATPTMTYAPPPR